MQKLVFILLLATAVIQVIRSEDETTEMEMELQMEPELGPELEPQSEPELEPEIETEMEMETTTVLPPTNSKSDKRSEELKRLEQLEDMFDNIITIETSNGTMTFDQFMDYEVNRYIHFYDSKTAFVLSEAAKLLQNVDGLIANTPAESEMLEFRKSIKHDVEQYLQRLFDGSNCGIRPIVILQASKFLQKLEGTEDDELVELWAHHYSAVTEALEAVGNVTEEKKARQSRFANDNEQLNSVYTFKFNKIYRQKCTNLH